jgi:hypothetical protein
MSSNKKAPAGGLADNKEKKKPWEAMKVTELGTISELVKQGSKSGVGGDPGDLHKPPGSG